MNRSLYPQCAWHSQVLSKILIHRDQITDCLFLVILSIFLAHFRTTISGKTQTVNTLGFVGRTVSWSY